MSEKIDINEFKNQYNEYISDTETLENGVLRIEFSVPGKVMWLKRMAYEKMDVTPITHSYGRNKTIYYFE